MGKRPNHTPTPSPPYQPPSRTSGAPDESTEGDSREPNGRPTVIGARRRDRPPPSPRSPPTRLTLPTRRPTRITSPRSVTQEQHCAAASHQVLEQPAIRVVTRRAGGERVETSSSVVAAARSAGSERSLAATASLIVVFAAVGTLRSAPLRSPRPETRKDARIERMGTRHYFDRT